MQILIYIVLIVLISYIIFRAYLIYSADDSDSARLGKLNNQETQIIIKNSDFNLKKTKLSSAFNIFNNKIKNEQLENPFANQFTNENITNTENNETYLQTLITTILGLKDFDLKNFRLYNNITLDYFDYETSKKTSIIIDNIIISPYGIITIKNINLTGLNIVDLNFNQGSMSKALEVISNNANIKTNEYTHPVVDAVNQSKALSSFFISKNIPNAFITPIVVYTNINDEFTQNKVLLKLENGEYSFINNICKINNLLGNKNLAYIMYSNALAPFLIDLKNNKDISRPTATYSKEDLYSFDLALLSLQN